MATAGQKFVIIYVVIAILLLSYFIVPFCMRFYVASNEVKQFYKQTSANQLAGKTAQEVIALLGKPANDSRSIGDTDEHFMLFYTGPYGERCWVEIISGKVSKIRHGGK